MDIVKTAVVTGVTGQLGSYLADILLEKGYRVIGVKRRSSTNNLWRVKHNLSKSTFQLVDADITDISSLNRIFNTYFIVECYNCAAQSFVATSFNEPIHTLEVTGKGVVNLLEVIKEQSPMTRLIHLSSSEMYGSNIDADLAQRETTPFCPNSPYAAAKLYAHNMVKIYRDSYDLWCASAIAFNMESPRRGEEFVTRKITSYIGKLVSGASIGKLKLGNLNAKRDWTYCKDTAYGLWTLAQQQQPNDYVFASAYTYSIHEFLDLAFKHVGLKWQDYVEIDQSLFRPNEVPYLRGDYSKVNTELGWSPSVSFCDLVKMMVDAEIQEKA